LGGAHFWASPFLPHLPRLGLPSAGPSFYFMFLRLFAIAGAHEFVRVDVAIDELARIGSERETALSHALHYIAGNVFRHVPRPSPGWGPTRLR